MQDLNTPRPIPNWYEYFIKQAELVKSRSRDRSTQVGVVIVGPDMEVIGTGYNGFPRGVDEELNERHQRPEKYKWVEHAERNAIYNAARHGQRLKGCAMFFEVRPSPCADCARGVVQAGIEYVIGQDVEFTGVGNGEHYHCDAGEQILLEGGVTIIVVDKNYVPCRVMGNKFKAEELDIAVQLLKDGNRWWDLHNQVILKLTEEIGGENDGY